MTARPETGTSSPALPSVNQPKILVVGAGWLGSAIAAAWALQGALVWTLSRSAPAQPSTPMDGDGQETGVRCLRGDICEAASEGGRQSLASALPNGMEHVVLCVAPSRERGDSYSVYPAAARGAVKLADSLSARSLLYTSSTGVYGVSDGSVVDEDRAIIPADARQQSLLEAEETIMRAGASSSLQRIVLRVAGLYGPGRDPSRRFLVPAQDDGSEGRWTNFAWRDDVVNAVLHLQTGAPRAQQAALYNCADGHPVLARDVTRALGREAGSPPSAPPPASGAAKSNQRVSVERLLATGWTPAVPSVYDGLARLGHAVQRA